MTMVILQGVFLVDPDQREQFLVASVDGMLASRQEDGCLEYVLAADPVDPRRVVLSERWESTEHLQEHLRRLASRRSEAAAGARPEPLDTQITVYEVAASRPLR